MRSAISMLWMSAVAVSSMGVAHGDTPFGNAYSFDPQDGPASLAVADLNRDGFNDLVMALIEGDEVKVRFGGVGASYLTLASGFDRACSVAVADVNGDGWLDVVAAKRGTGDADLRWWQNPGSGGGGWAEHPVSSTFFTEARSAAAADLDGDGDLDLLAAGVYSGTGYVSWFRNMDGLGTVWAGLDLAWDFTGAHDARPADVDGDGDLDVVAAAYDDDTVTWYENDGTITAPGLWPAHPVATGFDGAIAVAAADIDEDGDLDIVAGAYLGGDISWFANDGGVGTTWTPNPVTSTSNGVYSVQAVDADADGDLDIVAAARLADTVVWFENRALSFEEHVIEPSLDGARSAVAADWDRDGDLDVLAAAEFADAIQIWPGLATHRTAFFPTREVVDDSTVHVQVVEVADMDSDGDLDLITGQRDDSAEPDLIVWRQESSGWSPVVLDNDRSGVTRICVGDINRDGAPDLLVDAIYDEEVAWYENTGPTSFVEHVVATGYEVSDLDLADLDCDGDLDIVGDELNNTELTWWENTAGDGSVWTPVTIPTTFSPRRVRVGDADDDGDPDLLVTKSTTTGELWLLANDTCTGGGWSPSLVTDLYANDTLFGDFDGDGRTDLAVASFLNDTVAVLLNHGAWERHDVSTSMDGVESLVAADLDLDGDPDLASVAFYSGELRWWANDGTGTSWAESLIDDALVMTAGVAAGDLDRDGDPDLAVVEWSRGDISTYSNRGGQHLVKSEDLAPAYLADGTAAAMFRFNLSSNGRGFDPDIELRRVSLLLFDDVLNPITQAQASDLFAGVQVWHDANHDGYWSSTSDLLLLNEAPSLPADGQMYLEIDPGGGQPPIAGDGGSATYFVVLETTAGASTHLPSAFYLYHYPWVLNMPSYVAYPTIPLRGQWWPGKNTRLVTFGTEPGALFADDFESGGTSAWSTVVP